METLTAAYHPNDTAFRQKRQSMIQKDMRKWTTKELEEGFHYAASQERPSNIKEMSNRILGELATGAAMKQFPDRVKSILDSTGGGTSGGSVLVRQDLEPYLYALFVRTFPAFDRIRHLPSNGFALTSPRCVAKVA